MEFQFESIAEQFLQRVPGFSFARIIFRRSSIFAADHFEIFAVVCEMFFGDGLRATIAALLGDASVVANAIETNL